METNRRTAIANFSVGVGLLFFDQATVEPQAQVAGSRREALTGIGGFFFRAHDPKMLAEWYQRHLGIALTPQSYSDPVWRQEAGATTIYTFSAGQRLLWRLSENMVD